MLGCCARGRRHAEHPLPPSVSAIAPSSASAWSIFPSMSCLPSILHLQPHPASSLVSPSFPSPSNAPRSSHRPEPQVRGHFLVCGERASYEVTGRRRLLWGFGEEVSPQRCDKELVSCLDAWPLSRPLTKRDFHRSQTSHQVRRRIAHHGSQEPWGLSRRAASLAGPVSE